MLFSWIYRHPDWINSSKSSANCTIHLNGVFTLKPIYNLVNIFFIIYWFTCLLGWKFRLPSAANGVFWVYVLDCATYFIWSSPCQFHQHTPENWANFPLQTILVKVKIFLKHQVGDKISSETNDNGKFWERKELPDVLLSIITKVGNWEIKS